jgi:quercetin dioxygenase-like cupin family protein
MRSLLLAVVLLAQTMPAGITRTPLVENDTVMVARLSMAPGAREQTHTHPFSAVVVQLGPGEVEMRLGTNAETARRDRGHVEFIAAEMPHAAANVGSAPFDVVTVALKPGRKRGGEQAPTAARADITRTQVLENNDARVAQATFQPAAREPLHSHPFDMVIVQLDPGRMEVLVGEERTAKDYAAGDVVFLPRDVPHSVANIDTRPLRIASVTVK